MDVLFDLIILVGLLVLGVPVPFCFMAAVLFMFILGGYDPMFIMATGFHKTNSMAVLAILFTLTATFSSLLGHCFWSSQERFGDSHDRELCYIWRYCRNLLGGGGRHWQCHDSTDGRTGLSPGTRNRSGRGAVSTRSAHPSQCAHDTLCLGHLAIRGGLFLIHGHTRFNHCGAVHRG